MPTNCPLPPKENAQFKRILVSVSNAQNTLSKVPGHHDFLVLPKHEAKNGPVILVAKLPHLHVCNPKRIKYGAASRIMK